MENEKINELNSLETQKEEYQKELIGLKKEYDKIIQKHKLNLSKVLLEQNRVTESHNGVRAIIGIILNLIGIAVLIKLILSPIGTAKTLFVLASLGLIKGSVGYLVSKVFKNDQVKFDNQKNKINTDFVKDTEKNNNKEKELIESISKIDKEIKEKINSYYIERLKKSLKNRIETLNETEVLEEENVNKLVLK